MSVEEFFNRLEAVKRFGPGWTAKCPAHDDRTPSLSVREGERGILVKCWAGCLLEAICGAIGIQVRDLFYDTQCTPELIRRHQAKRQYEKATCEIEEMLRGFQIDAIREAERYLKTTVGTDISQVKASQFDTLMKSVCDALAVVIEEERSEYANAWGSRKTFS